VRYKREKTASPAEILANRFATGWCKPVTGEFSLVVLEVGKKHKAKATLFTSEPANSRMMARKRLLNAFLCRQRRQGPIADGIGLAVLSPRVRFSTVLAKLPDDG
jgi:hypothetical protein